MKSIFFLSLLTLLLFSCDNNVRENIRNQDILADDVAPWSKNGDAIPVRKVILTGSITFRTDHPKDVRKDITKITTGLQGYVSSENISNYPDKIEYSISIRVPAQNFEKLTEKVVELAKNVEEKNIQAEDVTLAYVDLEARLRTKKEMENRLLELLKKGNELKDLITIEKELQNTRAEIESMEAVLRNMQNKISYSTLNVTFYKQLPRSLAFSAEMKSSFLAGWKIFLLFLIGITKIWPFIIILIAIITIYSIKKKRNRSKLIK